MLKIKEDFYLKEDVVEIAKALIGKWLFTSFDGFITGGIICETEAYEGVVDKASHAYGGRRTTRTEVMYRKGGTAYVYLCYGVHSLFNIVTNDEGIPHAVLIRGIKPIVGLDIMAERAGGKRIGEYSAKGPGLLSKLLGIHFSHSGLSLSGDSIWLEDRGTRFDASKLIQTTRIGIDYAGDDALLPYRFVIDPGFIY